MSDVIFGALIIASGLVIGYYLLRVQKLLTEIRADLRVIAAKAARRPGRPRSGVVQRDKEAQ